MRKRDDLIAAIAACAEAQKQHLFGIANVTAFDYAERLVKVHEAQIAFHEEASRRAPAPSIVVGDTHVGSGGVSSATAPRAAGLEARPTHVRFIGGPSECFTTNKVYEVVEWADDATPIAKCDNDGKARAMCASEWVIPAAPPAPAASDEAGTSAEEIAKSIRCANRDGMFASPHMFDMLDAAIARARGVR